MELKFSHFIRSLCALTMLTFFSPVFADDESTVDFAEIVSEESAALDSATAADAASTEDWRLNELNYTQCQYYSNNPAQCNRIPGCQFSRIYNQCVSSGGGGPVQPVQCSRFNHDYNRCLNSGCYFDNRTGACYNGGGGNPQPQQCSRYNYNQYQCQQAGCYYNPQNGACYGGGGNPQPAQCSNYNYNQYQCQQAGCYYNQQNGACYGGNGNPQPAQCSRYNYNQYQCQQAGCYYNQQNGACYGGGGTPNFPGNNRSWACVAVDSGWEEHSSGHAGYAYDQVSAQRQALNSCQRYHGACRIRECRQQ